MCESECECVVYGAKSRVPRGVPALGHAAAKAHAVAGRWRSVDALGAGDRRAVPARAKAGAGWVAGEARGLCCAILVGVGGGSHEREALI